MKILIIGGSGTISHACAIELINKGHELYLLNRGQSLLKPVPGANLINADIRKRQQVEKALQGFVFDSVINFLVFNKEQVEQDIEFFKSSCGQYIFISSASVYHKPVKNLPVTESTPVYNPFSIYAQNKISAERRLISEYNARAFPFTIVRPSHTYAPWFSPIHGKYTMWKRMKEGKKIVIPGDGTSLWVLTHSTDFARAFSGLVGNPEAIGEIFHITSDELLTWNQIYEYIGNGLGVEINATYIPSNLIAEYDKQWGESLLGDKTYSVFFDNTKIKRVVPTYNAEIPFWQGIKEMVNYFEYNPEWQIIDQHLDAVLDKMIEDYESYLSKIKNNSRIR